MMFNLFGFEFDTIDMCYGVWVGSADTHKGSRSLLRIHWYDSLAIDLFWVRLV